MVIVTKSDIENWTSQNILATVETFFTNNSGKWISDCITANSGLTYEQVAWALAYSAKPSEYPLMALPQSDSELSTAIELNALWNS